jgi:glycine/D-amino acid oxidase-like deaminating enzyme
MATAPPAAAEIVVIGAGIAGLSTAYHLVQHGKSNVVVFEQGKKLLNSGGSTSHAPGGIADGDLRSDTMCDFAATSRALYEDLGCLRAVPSLKIARTPARLRELEAEVTQHSVPSSTLTPHFP